MGSAERDNRLMRFLDGDLPPSERPSMESAIEDDAQLAAKAAGLTALTELVGLGADAMAEDLDSEALFAGIQARLDAGAEDDGRDFLPSVAEAEPAPEVAPARPRLRAIEGGRRSVAPPTTGRAPAPWVGGLALGAVAAAAAALVAVMPAPGPAPQPPTAVAISTEIEDVDFGSSTGAIFTVEEEGAHYAVLWISDEVLVEGEAQ